MHCTASCSAISSKACEDFSSNRPVNQGSVIKTFRPSGSRSNTLGRSTSLRVSCQSQPQSRAFKTEIDPNVKENVIQPFIKGVQELVAPPTIQVEPFEVMNVHNTGARVVHATCGGTSRLCVSEDGSFTLTRIEMFDSHRLICRGSFILPDGVEHDLFNWILVDGKLEISWGSEVCVQISPAISGQEKSHSWQQGLENGFDIKYTVMSHVSSMAEVVVDVATSGMWFGGSHLMRQHWPLNTGSWEVGPHYPFDNGPHGLNTLVSSHWMTSNGLLVMVDPDNPFMHVGFNAPRQSKEDGFIQRSWGVGIQNMSKEYLPRDACRGAPGDGLLHLQARQDYMDFDVNHPMLDWRETVDECSMDAQSLDESLSEGTMCNDGSPMTLHLALCSQSNIRAAAQMALAAMPQPQQPQPQQPQHQLQQDLLQPSSAATTTTADGVSLEVHRQHHRHRAEEKTHAFIRAPIWTTWARYGAKVSQKKVMQFANEIVERKLERSVMEIDDKWQSKYGDLEFDGRKFPDPTGMCQALHEQGFQVTLWVMPFFEKSSQAYKEGAPKGYFCLDDEDKPGFFQWWNTPEACALDVTNPEATRWFVDRLKALQSEFGIDGYKFDAGEPCFLPRRFTTHIPLTTPSDYTRLYIQNVASHFDLCEVRTGHRNQDLTLFTRMGDRFSTWGLSNGLRSLIPTLLTSGLAGYPFCLPDMIGGNAYFGQKPDMELMVRWAQVNALMPAMQFSIAPWDLSKEADVLCQQALEMRKKLLQKLMAVAADAGHALEPMCRPMWWLDPEDEETYAIKDQFVVGDDVIVAPVVYQGHVTRDIYLTQGSWSDLMNPEHTYSGGQWLEGFDAPLHKLPIFVKVPQPEDPAAAL